MYLQLSRTMMTMSAVTPLLLATFTGMPLPVVDVDDSYATWVTYVSARVSLDKLAQLASQLATTLTCHRNNVEGREVHERNDPRIAQRGVRFSGRAQAINMLAIVANKTGKAEQYCVRVFKGEELARCGIPVQR
jgi:hypothetical protein